MFRFSTRSWARCHWGISLSRHAHCNRSSWIHIGWWRCSTHSHEQHPCCTFADLSKVSTLFRVVRNLRKRNRSQWRIACTLQCRVGLGTRRIDSRRDSRDRPSSKRCRLHHNQLYFNVVCRVHCSTCPTCQFRSLGLRGSNRSWCIPQSWWVLRIWLVSGNGSTCTQR